MSAARLDSVSSRRLAPVVSSVVLEGRRAVQGREGCQLLPHFVLFCTDGPNNITTGDNVFLLLSFFKSATKAALAFSVNRINGCRTKTFFVRKDVNPPGRR